MPDPIVTDHCLLRYVERVLEINLRALRSAIAAECRDAIRAGASSKITGPVRYEFKNGAVVTVTKKAAGLPCKSRRETLARGKA